MSSARLNACLEAASKLQGLTCRTRLDSALRDVAEVLEATVYTAQYFCTGGHGMSAYSVHNVPRGALESFNCPRSSRADPVMQRLRVSSTPIVWGRETYASVGNPDWVTLADFDMHQGVSLALHLDDRRHFVVGLCWNDRRKLPFEDARLLNHVVQVLAVFAEPAVHRLWLAEQRARVGGLLTDRESECLQWICRGLSDELIASAMGISYRGVRKHVASVVAKLGAVNRTEAAVTAVKVGLAS